MLQDAPQLRPQDRRQSCTYTAADEPGTPGGDQRLEPQPSEVSHEQKSLLSTWEQTHGQKKKKKKQEEVKTMSKEREIDANEVSSLLELTSGKNKRKKTRETLRITSLLSKQVFTYPPTDVYTRAYAKIYTYLHKHTKESGPSVDLSI